MVADEDLQKVSFRPHRVTDGADILLAEGANGLCVCLPQDAAKAELVHVGDVILGVMADRTDPICLFGHGRHAAVGWGEKSTRSCSPSLAPLQRVLHTARNKG